ncbi:uncharacterized protein TNCV_957571 [Trichonephila clavipes]|nr:uncharacterized protein TNCV_957571 [Trichonephila clavipes]
MKNYEGRPSFSPVYSGASTSPRTGDTSSSLGPWNRVGSKDYYKMNGYTLKSTSATKRALDPSAIPQVVEIQIVYFNRSAAYTAVYKPMQMVPESRASGDGTSLPIAHEMVDGIS